MRWFCDRTGYPVLELPAARRAVHLLPVAKRQFERFLAEPGSFGDAWYEALLTVSPRLSLAEATPANYEPLFAGGLFPAEAEQFARWLGDGFDLPPAADWRDAYSEMLQQPFDAAEVEALQNDAAVHPNARALVGWVMQNLKPQNWAELGLMRGGLLEWVRERQGTFGGFGVPRNEFQVVIVNPERDSPVRPVYADRRYRYFGFRLARPLPEIDKP